MTSLAEFNRIVKHVWTEPKHVAMIEWLRDHLDPIQQMFAQIGSEPRRDGISLPTDEAVRDWLTEYANAKATVEIHEMPDFDWWEPRHDQPWRRQATRDREAGL